MGCIFPSLLKAWRCQGGPCTWRGECQSYRVGEGLLEMVMLGLSCERIV